MLFRNHSWKGVSCFSGGEGGGCFSDGGHLIFKWGGASVLVGGGRGFEKSCKMGGTPSPSMPPSTMGNPVHFSDYILMTFLMMWSIILLIIYVDDTTLYSKCDRASDLWQQPEMAEELESGLQDTVDLCRNWLFDFSAGKNLVRPF